MHSKSFSHLLRDEFNNYSNKDFKADVLSALTVTAVSLPLALAFGVASGASAASGMITAIIAGLIIGFFSGASYQISGPTGAMSAVLLVVAQVHGVQAVFISGAVSGLLLIMLGYFRLGRFISFIPSPVIVGFTAGISLIIAVGQINNIFSINSQKANSALGTLRNLLLEPLPAIGVSFYITAFVALIIICWPKKLAEKFPPSLLAIIVAGILNHILDMGAAVVGEIPKTLILPERLELSNLLNADYQSLLFPILAITALGAIESLLCGSVGSSMTGKRLYANQELLAQGAGNLLVPFFGGVPATAAIARTSIAIKSGGKTRLVSVFQSIFLLITVIFCTDIMGQIPLSALAGVLLITAWRMNDWHSIRFYFSRSIKSAIVPFFVTLIATFCLDLTVAIIIGTLLSALIFLTQAAKIDISVSEIKSEELSRSQIPEAQVFNQTKVVYLSGLLFFAAASTLSEACSELKKSRLVVLSIRGVPQIDASCFEIIYKLHKDLIHSGGRLVFAGTTQPVMNFFKKLGFDREVGKDNFFWSTDQALREMARQFTSNSLDSPKK